MIKKIKKFLFPDDTKIKVECVTNISRIDGKLKINREFYTLRSLFVFFRDEWFLGRLHREAKQQKMQWGTRYWMLDPQRGAIAFSAATSGQVSDTSLTFSHTISGSNTVLTVGHSSTRSATDCTYNSVAMVGTTEESDASGFARLFYLGNPTAGANNVVLTLASSGNVKAGAVSFTGANSSSPLDAEAQATASSNSDLTINITTNYANSFLIDSVHKQDDPTANGSQTLRWSNTTGDFGGGSTKPTTTAGAYSMNWTSSFSTIWGGTTIAIREFVASASGTKNLTLLGVG